MHPKAKIVVLPEVDGIGFQRSIRLEGAVAKLLGPALELMRDHRIAEVVTSSKGTRVTFVSSTQADYAYPFPLTEVLDVLSED